MKDYNIGIITFIMSFLLVGIFKDRFQHFYSLYDLMIIILLTILLYTENTPISDDTKS